MPKSNQIVATTRINTLYVVIRSSAILIDLHLIMTLASHGLSANNILDRSRPAALKWYSLNVEVVQHRVAPINTNANEEAAVSSHAAHVPTHSNPHKICIFSFIIAIIRKRSTISCIFLALFHFYRVTSSASSSVDTGHIR
jgi:hypothetical protein